MSKVHIVDIEDRIIGAATREEAHRDTLLHRVAATYLYNDAGEILVNERAKDGYLDHSSAGHVEIGETYLEAAKRELSEELGVSDVELEEVGSTRGEMHILQVYRCKTNPGMINPSEVKSVYWAATADISEDMKINPDKYARGFKKTLVLYLSKF